MNTLQESKSANQPDKDMSTKTTPASAAKEVTPQGTRKPKTPLRKEELEKIAQELKKKLSKASVAAKQLLTSLSTNASRTLPPDSPVLLTSLPKSSPLKNYYMWRRQIASGSQNKVTLLPSLYSPERNLPTLTKPSIFLSSSPLKNFASGSPNENSSSRSRKSSVGSDQFTDANGSPIKRRRAESGAAIKSREPHMVLEEMKAPQTPPKHSSLHPSPVLSSNPENANAKKQTTPTISKRRLSLSSSHALLLKTPTQQGRGDAYNDEEGADLLMYLATSPSVSKTYTGGNTPRAPSVSSASQNSAFANTSATAKSHALGNLFIAPPPLTPKRPVVSTAKTPQNRLTPSVYGGLAVPGSALPSAGLALTPAGFNMNDYVNFFTPSPGQAAAGHGGGMTGRTLLKTPDFHSQVSGNSQTSVDGKMINFDKAELFGLSGPEQSKY